MRQELDLEHHILYTAFKNKFITPEDQESTQQLISRLMVDYPHIFPSSLKISYAIASMKTQGLIYEEFKIDNEGLQKCLEETRQQHPKMKDSNVKKECYRKLGLKAIIQPTEAGIAEYCSRVKPYIAGRTTRTNTIILDVCKTYKVEGEQL
jgi:hypothetical protein